MQQVQGGDLKYKSVKLLLVTQTPYEILKGKNRGLREALKRQTTMVIGEQIPSTERV